MPNSSETQQGYAEPTYKDIRPMKVFAGGEVRVYGGHNPRTTIDLRTLHLHISVRKFDPFDSNIGGEINEVVIRRDHHESKTLLSFSGHDNGTPYEYDIFSPEGLLGSASGENLDLLIASLFYDDPKLKERAKDNKMDEKIEKYLKSHIDPGANHNPNP